jgi:hypothetical protein
MDRRICSEACQNSYVQTWDADVLWIEMMSPCIVFAMLLKRIRTWQTESPVKEDEAEGEVELAGGATKTMAIYWGQRDVVEGGGNR